MPHPFRAHQIEGETAEEIVGFIGAEWDERHVRAKNIVLIARYHRNVVGFIFCHFYPDRRKAIVSYFGIDRHVAEARRSAATKLLRKLTRILKSRKRGCEYLFFDLEKPDCRPRRTRSGRPGQFCFVRARGACS